MVERCGKERSKIATKVVGDVISEENDWKDKRVIGNVEEARCSRREE